MVRSDILSAAKECETRDGELPSPHQASGKKVRTETSSMQLQSGPESGSRFVGFVGLGDTLSHYARMMGTDGGAVDSVSHSNRYNH